MVINKRRFPKILHLLYMGKSRYRINRTPTDAIAKCEHKKTNFPKWPTPIIENFQKHLKKKKKSSPILRL